MKIQSSAYLPKRLTPIALSLLFSIVVLLGWLSQVSADTDEQNIELSHQVLSNEGVPGGTIQYGITISNTGDSTITFSLTDTVPVSTTLILGSVEKSCDFDLYTSVNEITSGNYTLQPGQLVTATYKVEVDTNIPHDQVAASGLVSEIPNTIFIEDIISGDEISNMVGTTVVTESIKTFLPAIFSASSMTESNRSIQQAVVKVVQPKVRALPLEKSSSFKTFVEDFSPNCPHSNWQIVRQDKDTIVNKLSVHDGYLDLRMESRFDYMIVSNLLELPEQPYRLTARMRLEDADPRHTGGIILGGDYDGISSCPESVDETNPENSKYTTCFNEYYRFIFIAGSTPNQFTTQVKRIEEHSEENNSGSGTELASRTFTAQKDAKNWIEWSVEVYNDGTMKLFLDDELIHEVVDTTYQDNKYFGFWSSTSDTTFSNTQIDWVRVEEIE